MTKGFEEIAEDQVLSVEEALQLKERLVEASPTPQWRWMGNYSVYDLVAAANGFGCKSGGLVTTLNSSGNFATFMFF